MTDPIADMLTRIRNTLMVKKTEVVLPYSKIKFALAKILEQEKWIEKAEVFGPGDEEKKFIKKIRIVLKYEENGQSLIKTIKRISKPGRRVYVKKDKINKVLNGQGINVLSTSQGLMIGQRAKEKGLGGEVICEIW
ncbi:MAG: 30S ribosomal protein S8 [Patescibacteria group bacterium]|jgi:small subunit ribosomal protein S8|nr:30S ribosomal protein S8 [Patescibacteria group bacterium]MDD5172925.1 30S ribosomal protein S8 [Patescibacteria group bacterium]